MSTPPTAAALVRFEATLARIGHPLAHALRPGLDGEDIRSRTSGVGVRVPEDAVGLWEWHDGVDQALLPPTVVPRSEALPGGPSFLSLTDALQNYVWTVENFPFSDLDDWSTDWFPAFTYSNGDTIYLDCSAPPEGPTPLQYRALKDYNRPADRHRRRIGSIAEAFDVWTSLLDRGLWAVDPRSDAYDLTRDPDPDLPVAWLLG